jgi:predicted nucleic acid-binding protein
MSGERYLLDTNAIIAATALHCGAVLITEDQQLRNVPSLNALGLG